jgi:lipoate-protein ligase B
LNTLTPLNIEDWGVLDYQVALERQTEMVQQYMAGQGTDTLVLVEHPATVTLGRRATGDDLRMSEAEMVARQVSLQRINRGGLATAHEPGQLVAYPILLLKKRDLHWFANNFLGAVIDLLAEYGLQGELKAGEPGVWVSGRKICSFGIALKKWVCSHGIALNVNNDLTTFATIIPCGRPSEVVTSMSRELGYALDLSEVKQQFCRHFSTVFLYKY